MKKLLTLAVTMLLAASLSFAQGTTGSTDTATGKKATKSKSVSKKGGKKSKKSSGGTTTTTAPK
ncbi:MAG: hypothetical protein LAP21_08090 [Acidobacteriia bacterium]|nr:hypothetical protein [Terriglobia bacterium]